MYGCHANRWQQKEACIINKRFLLSFSLLLEYTCEKACCALTMSGGHLRTFNVHLLILCWFFTALELRTVTNIIVGYYEDKQQTNVCYFWTICKDWSTKRFLAVCARENLDLKNPVLFVFTTRFHYLSNNRFE